MMDNVQCVQAGVDTVEDVLVAKKIEKKRIVIAYALMRIAVIVHLIHATQSAAVMMDNVQCVQAGVDTVEDVLVAQKIEKKRIVIAYALMRIAITVHLIHATREQ